MVALRDLCPFSTQDVWMQLSQKNLDLLGLPSY